MRPFSGRIPLRFCPGDVDLPQTAERRLGVDQLADPGIQVFTGQLLELRAPGFDLFSFAIRTFLPA